MNIDDLPPVGSEIEDVSITPASPKAPQKGKRGAGGNELISNPSSTDSELFEPPAKFDSEDAAGDEFMTADMLAFEEALSHEEARHRRMYPSLYFIPNRGQEKFFRTYTFERIHPRFPSESEEEWEQRRQDWEHKPYKESEFAYINVFGAGNGVGKTASLAIFMVGLLWGEDYLHDSLSYLFPFLRKYRKWIRHRNRPSYLRIICPSDSMKHNGSVYQAVMEWFPKGLDQRTGKKLWGISKEGSQFYTSIVTSDGSSVGVKTQEQKLVSHTGTTIDWMLYDEPCDRDTYNESVARTRGGGCHAFFLTPLKLAGWMIEQIMDDIDGKTRVLNEASIYDNCRDIPGTRGHLDMAHIENLKREWAKMGQEELDARMYGKFFKAAGVVFKIYDREVHEVEDFPIPSSWPIWFIIDPHDTKPPFVCWIAQGPRHSYVIKEHPSEAYSKIPPSVLTIEQTCELYRQAEAPFAMQIAGRYMDPNKGKFTYSNTKKTVQQEYINAGMVCTLAKGGDDISIGHDRVKGLLYYDSSRPFHEQTNCPKLRVFRSCKNMSASFRGYGFKEGKDPSIDSLSNALDQTYKDPMDCVRYYAMSERPYEPITFLQNFEDQIYAGRIKTKRAVI